MEERELIENEHTIEVTLYTQPDCPLCDDAEVQLGFAREEIPFTVNKVDITQDDQLMELWQLRVPVVVYQDAIIQEGNIDFVTVIEELSKYF